MTSYIYLTITHLNSSKGTVSDSLRLVDNAANAYKISLLKEGKPATFNLPKHDPRYTKLPVDNDKVIGSDKVTKQTITLYPHSFESMVIKTVESEFP